MKLPKILKACRVDKPERFHLGDCDPAETFGLDVDKADVKAMLADGVAKLGNLQQRLSGPYFCCSRAWMPRARTVSSSM